MKIGEQLKFKLLIQPDEIQTVDVLFPVVSENTLMGDQPTFSIDLAIAM